VQYDWLFYNNVFVWYAASYRLPLGVQDKRIPHSAMQASSRWDRNHGPFRGRLFTCIEGRLIGAWSSRHNNLKQWLQIDVGSPAIVAGIATQGRQGINQWVKSYTLGTSKDGIRFKTFTVRKRVKVCINCEKTVGAATSLTDSAVTVRHLLTL
jgi:hypothetical protein